MRPQLPPEAGREWEGCYPEPQRQHGFQTSQFPILAGERTHLGCSSHLSVAVPAAPVNVHPLPPKLRGPSRCFQAALWSALSWLPEGGAFCGEPGTPRLAGHNCHLLSSQASAELKVECSSELPPGLGWGVAEQAQPPGTADSGH